MVLSPLIFLSALVILCYLFEVSAPRTRIPTVVVLLLLGMACRELLGWLDVQLPDLARLLPDLGTVGLILIVLEGSLELEFSRDKRSLIQRAIVMAVVPLVVFAAVVAWHLVRLRWRRAAVALPLVISSAVAVPTSRLLGQHDAEFVVYESSFSDILGVLAFNFVLNHETFGVDAVVSFLGQIVASAALALVGSVLLSALIARLQHRIKFVPILALVILLYSIAKAFHLPALVLILSLGLLLANFRKLAHFPWIARVRLFQPDSMELEVRRFSELTVELTFVVRIAFFLLFGFLVDFRDLLHLGPLEWAIALVGLALLIRGIGLLAVGMRVAPLVFIAPRGLITVLLLLSIPPALRLPNFSNTLTSQVVLLSALAMMVATVGRFGPRDSESGATKLGDPAA
jgi:hypothetical protein